MEKIEIAHFITLQKLSAAKASKNICMKEKIEKLNLRVTDMSSYFFAKLMQIKGSLLIIFQNTKFKTT